MAFPQTYLFVCMFGSSTWLTINAIWVELSLYTSRLPENWSLPSYLAAIIQLACVGPLLYSVLHKCVGLRIEKPPLILALLLLATVSMLLLAFFWESTLFIFGAQRSVAIILLTFSMSLVAATSNVLFLPFMATFHPNYLTAYFVGMSFSSLVPSVLKLIQGVGNYDCVPSDGPNGTSSTLIAVQMEPLFHIRLYNLVMFAWMCAATVSFCILYWNGRTKTTARAQSNSGIRRQQEDNEDGDNSNNNSITMRGHRQRKLVLAERLSTDKANGSEETEDGAGDERRREQCPLKKMGTI